MIGFYAQEQTQVETSHFYFAYVLFSQKENSLNDFKLASFETEIRFVYRNSEHLKPVVTCLESECNLHLNTSIDWDKQKHDSSTVGFYFENHNEISSCTTKK